MQVLDISLERVQKKICMRIVWKGCSQHHLYECAFNDKDLLIEKLPASQIVRVSKKPLYQCSDSSLLSLSTYYYHGYATHTHALFTTR